MHASPRVEPPRRSLLSPTMSASPHQAYSDRLKTEGNALFSKSDFAGAYQRYTAAIQLDSENAILYCNRAACAFALGRYDDASSLSTLRLMSCPRYLDSCTDATKVALGCILDEIGP